MNFLKTKNQKWKPYAHFIYNSKVYIIEYDELNGNYRYIKVPFIKEVEESE